MTHTTYTIKAAAEALGLSTRTIRRRLKEGKLSATKRHQGERQIWIIDAAELARYAQSIGQTLTIVDTSSNLQAGDSRHEMAFAGSGQAAEIDNSMTETGAITAYAANIDRLSRTVEALERERDFLRDILQNLTKALPPHRSYDEREEMELRIAALEEELQQEQRARQGAPPWWQRLFGRK